jgi:hypothetical protein
MGELALGMIAAVGASTLYSLGVAFQAIEAKTSPASEHLRLALAWNLIRRGRWLLGTGMSILGWPLQVLALLLAPLVVVQPTLAAGLLVLMVVGQRMLHEHAGRREHLAVVAIVVGVLGVAACAPAKTTTHSNELVLTLVLVGLGLASILPYMLRMVGRQIAPITMIGAGLGFAWSGVATKLAADDLSRGSWQVALAWGISTACASAVAALSEMSALQQRPAIQVAPVVFVIQTVVPVMLAPLLLDEKFSATPLGGIPLVASLGVLIGGAAVLVRSPLLIALMEGEATSVESGSARSRSEEMRATSPSSPATDVLDPSALTTTTSPARSGS